MSEPDSAWTTGKVVELERIGDRFVKVRLDVANRVDHLPGQHYVVRLRAPDDYTAQRSYSVASEPDDPLVELMVECLPGGEVSGHLHDVAEVGDVFELRGPIGGRFIAPTYRGGARRSQPLAPNCSTRMTSRRTPASPRRRSAKLANPAEPQT